MIVFFNISLNSSTFCSKPLFKQLITVFLVAIVFITVTKFDQSIYVKELFVRLAYVLLMQAFIKIQRRQAIRQRARHYMMVGFQI